MDTKWSSTMDKKLKRNVWLFETWIWRNKYFNIYNQQHRKQSAAALQSAAAALQSAAAALQRKTN
jgi:uncharacterized membrane protein YbaN (DUF454 family)